MQCAGAVLSPGRRDHEKNVLETRQNRKETFYKGEGFLVVSCSDNVSTYLSVTPPESGTEGRIRKRNRQSMGVDLGPDQGQGVKQTALG